MFENDKLSACVVGATHVAIQFTTPGVPLHEGDVEPRLTQLAVGKLSAVQSVNS